jgi:hypothetical protein
VNRSQEESNAETLMSGGVRPEPAPEAGVFGGLPSEASLGDRPGSELPREPGGWQSPLPPAEPAVQDRSPFDLPPSSGPDVFNTPPAAGGVGGLRQRMPLVIGCCAGAALLACLAIFGLGSWILNSGGF